MNIKAQDFSNLGKKVGEVIDALPPTAKTVVVVLGTGAVFFFSVSEACKNATIFAKEGLPPMVENINKGINLLKQGSPTVIVDEPCDAQIVDDPSAA